MQALLFFFNNTIKERVKKLELNRLINNTTEMLFQGVDRPYTTPIGQDRKFKDHRALL